MALKRFLSFFLMKNALCFAEHFPLVWNLIGPLRKTRTFSSNIQKGGLYSKDVEVYHVLREVLGVLVFRN